MALDPRNAFKIGFLLKCAEAGVSPAAHVGRADAMTKRADPGVLSWLGSGALSGTGNTLGLAALGLPVGVGLGGGYLAHKAMENPTDEQDVKDGELSEEYRRLARQARLAAKLKAARRHTGV